MFFQDLFSVHKIVFEDYAIFPSGIFYYNPDIGYRKHALLFNEGMAMLFSLLIKFLIIFEQWVTLLIPSLIKFFRWCFVQ